ncbi:TPA: GxxExxY protein [Candidatus Komeilibacteria bacterium]|nr:MAG: hypothetical protein UW91_C0047G0008 [Parcubacteria group bacterium GW2011_GWF2_45_11]KKT98300.1 MAG: hypothetical protein UW98_C0008G0012 [Parcubacteria group bacterium GW2011_GWC2_45_15]OGY94382.1 MAG: hypothetical protein A2260_00575 [Candidatus Komeilibacteria bacterium RIFOXYA2_FULL_45_9]OGY95079.1 MAG: hypothetical protein A3J95_04720 [Candidatus Komeilibacteria bacterium RIFOXYC2_FULL_45_12]HAH04024.1 GxxExxY protein [Candidatus Komeilibacteria bacterium]
MKSDLIYPDFSFKIIGILFDVYNELGFGYQEKYYQRAIASVFYKNKNKIKFKEQVKIPLAFKRTKIGYYYLDFLIEDKIILEIKRGNYFSRQNIGQVYAYLKATNLKSGILANFTNKGVRYKRIINLY